MPRRAAPTEVPRPSDVSSDVEATLCGRPYIATCARPPTLGEVIGWLKTMTTNEYIRRVKAEGWPPFAGRLWQRNYYERVIRNEQEYDAICRYIADNPANWAQDAENPGR